jgi:hypothetical protein
MNALLLSLVLSSGASATNTIKATLLPGVSATKVYNAAQPIDVAQFSYGSLNPSTMTVRCKGQTQGAACTIEGAGESHPVTSMSTQNNGTKMTTQLHDVIVSSIVLRME